MSTMSPSARAAVMSAMPVSAGQVVADTIVHFAFAAVTAAAAWAKVPGLRTSGGIVTAGGSAGRWCMSSRVGPLPPVNPLMAFVPQIAFFLARLLFGLVVGIVLAVALCRPGVARYAPRPVGNGGCTDRRRGQERAASLARSGTSMVL